MRTPVVPNETAQLFRSVRAARSWIRAGAARPDLPAAGDCVVMKLGDGEPPVFMLPGAAGSVLQLAPIAAAMTGPMPVYAIKPRGTRPGEPPCDHLTEMAEYAIAAMRTVHLHGPYVLAGYSAGGLVALEAARLLTEAGHKVPLVVLLDTYPSRATWPLTCHLEILSRTAIKAIWSLRRYTPRQAAREANRRIGSLLAYLAASGVKLIQPPQVIAEGSDAASRRIHLATYNAGEAYRPHRYSGKVVFVQAGEIPNLEPREPRRVWGRYLSDLEVCQVPGSHLAIVDAGAAAAAAAISRHIALTKVS